MLLDMQLSDLHPTLMNSVRSNSCDLVALHEYSGSLMRQRSEQYMFGPKFKVFSQQHNGCVLRRVDLTNIANSDGQSSSCDSRSVGNLNQWWAPVFVLKPIDPNKIAEFLCNQVPIAKSPLVIMIGEQFHDMLTRKKTQLAWP
jgi:hypothetical protein